MTLKEILEKQKKGEELTPEEQILLDDFNKIQEQSALELEKLQNEKKALELEKSNSEETLQETLRKAEEKEKALEELRKERANLEDMIKNSKDNETAKIALAKAQMDKSKAEEIRRIQAEKEKEQKILKQKEEAREAERKAIEQKTKELEEMVAKLQFEQVIKNEMNKRPYFKNQLENISKNLDTKGIEKSKDILDFLIESVNHEEEIKKFNASLVKGKNVFVEDGLDKKIVDKKPEEMESKELEFAKSMGYNIRK